MHIENTFIQRSWASYFTLHHDLDLPRLYNVETISFVSLRRKKRHLYIYALYECKDLQRCSVKLHLINASLTCVMIRSASVNCFAPNTSTSFILSVAWKERRQTFKGKWQYCRRNASKMLQIPPKSIQLISDSSIRFLYFLLNFRLFNMRVWGWGGLNWVRWGLFQTNQV